ncbi:MAG: GLUG motif-containing protein, partial [Rikenellaceae bacterium]
MKKLLVLLTLLLLVASCTKEIEVSSSGDTSGEAVNFTASVVDVTQTKATLINSWSGGEQVALFVGETLYWYTIAEDGTMSGDEVIVDREASITYTAFYPYDPDLSTIAEYESACTAGNVDYMSATTTTSGKAVELQFSHKMAALSFTIFIEGTVTDPAISLALDGDFNSAIALEVDASISAAASRLTANYFLAAGTDISEAMIKLEQSGSTSIHSIKREESNTLEVGKQYPFSYTIGDLPTGSGVEGDPYIVYTADDMRKVGTEGWALNSHYLLAWDIDLENIEFTPIGAESYSMIFKGTFDGGGHQISGLYINQQSNDYQGLFGYISGATIKNLGVSGSVTGCSRVGGVAGYANWSKVDNCYFTGSVKGYSSHIGGVAGYIYQQSTVNNCYNTGS